MALQEDVIFKSTTDVVWLDKNDVNWVPLLAEHLFVEGMIGSSLSFVKDTDSLTWNIGF